MNVFCTDKLPQGINNLYAVVSFSKLFEGDNDHEQRSKIFDSQSEATAFTETLQPGSYEQLHTTVVEIVQSDREQLLFSTKSISEMTLHDANHRFQNELLQHKSLAATIDKYINSFESALEAYNRTK